MALRRKNTNNQIQRLDRFIPTRDSASLNELRSRQKLYLQYGTDTWNIKQNKRKKYMMRVDEAFGLEPLKAYSNIIRPNDECAQQSWPCVPRKKKCLAAADNVLDLPAYSHAPFPELLDWSYNNVIVAALGNKYYKWDFTDQTLISENLTLQWINCCKFDPTGELIALGTSRKIVEIHKLRLGKYLERKYCLCNCTYRNCSITALDWSSTGKSFVTGCSTGMITCFNQNGVLISCGHFEYNAILTVKISSNSRYVAVAGVNSSNVFIYTWPQLKLFSSFSCDGNVKSLAWHPWRSALLCVGIVTSDLCTQLALYDAPPGKLTEIICHRQHILDTMLFNNATGELVLSLWNTENRVNLRGGSLLLVLRDLETVVDHWGDDGLADLDQIRTMVFSPDGTKLATATASEDLMIWNFLPENQKRKNSKFYKPNRFTKIPTYLDQISTGYSVR